MAVLVTAIMALYLAVSLPLSPDEAHYALYGTYLDWSYFDHPPMVGWVQSFFLLFGSHEFLLRLAPLSFSLFTGILLFRLVRQQVSEQAAWLAVLLYVATPMLRLLGLAWVPETPLMLVGMGCLIFTLRINASALQQTLWADWLGLGVCIGLAALSKYTAVTLALSVALSLIYAHGWQVLASLRLWLAAVVAGVFLLPVLWWNYQHDWMSFLYQLNHGAGDSSWSPAQALQMQAGQFLSYGPFVYVLGLIASVWACRDPERRTKYMAYLLFAWPILILFSVLAAKGRSLPHWTAMGVLFLLPVIAAFLMALWSRIRASLGYKMGLLGLGSLSLILLVVSYLALTGVNLGYRDYQHPLQDFVGWQQAAEKSQSFAQADAPEFQQLFVPNWSHGSRYAWYGRPLPVKVLDTRVDQFDLWFGAAEAGDSGYLILHREKDKFHSDLLSRFRECALMDEFTAEVGSVKVNQFKIYRCSQYL